MKKFVSLFALVSFVLVSYSCDGNQYEFIGSRQGELFLYDPDISLEDLQNPNYKSKSIYVAVDVFRKKSNGGFTYKIRSQEGNEYTLWESTMLSPYTHSAANFRYKNYVGTIHIQL